MNSLFLQATIHWFIEFCIMGGVRIQTENMQTKLTVLLENQVDFLINHHILSMISLIFVAIEKLNQFVKTLLILYLIALKDLLELDAFNLF